jgi:hypothetical protein
MALRAVEHMRRMRGGAQSHLMRCSDEQYYVVKFRNNPQGPRVLANEMLASHLAMSLGLPVSEPDVVLVSNWVIDHTPELFIQNGDLQEKCASGFAFASRFPCDPLRSPAFDYLPAEQLSRVDNRDDFAGMLVFDQWTCNCDSRQLVFHFVQPEEPYLEPTYHATMIDQGYCFNGNRWEFPDAPRRGLYANSAAYLNITGMNSFDPWLQRVEAFPNDLLDEAARAVPVEWYEGGTAELVAMMATLADRRKMVRQLVQECVQASPHSFPNWRC